MDDKIKLIELYQIEIQLRRN